MVTNKHTGKNIFIRRVYIAALLETTSNCFVALLYWCVLEKGALHFDIFSIKSSSHVECPPSGAIKW